MTSTRAFDRLMRGYDAARAREYLDRARSRWRREHPQEPETLTLMEACQCVACLELHAHLEESRP
jgi:hypothetical protein